MKAIRAPLQNEPIGLTAHWINRNLNKPIGANISGSPEKSFTLSVYIPNKLKPSQTYLVLPKYLVSYSPKVIRSHLKLDPYKVHTQMCSPFDRSCRLSGSGTGRRINPAWTKIISSDNETASCCSPLHRRTSCSSHLKTIRTQISLKFVSGLKSVRNNLNSRRRVYRKGRKGRMRTFPRRTT